MLRRQFLTQFALGAAGLYVAPKLIFDYGAHKHLYLSIYKPSEIGFERLFYKGIELVPDSKLAADCYLKISGINVPGQRYLESIDKWRLDRNTWPEDVKLTLTTDA